MRRESFLEFQRGEAVMCAKPINFHRLPMRS